MAANANKAEVKETIFLPKIPGEDNSVYVGINDRSWLIPRGKSVEVPKYVADFIRDRQRMQEQAEMYSADEKAKANTIQGI